MACEIEKKEIVVNMIQDFCFVEEDELLTAEECQHLDAYKDPKEAVRKENEEE
jgi:hypothetical protein